MRTSLLSCSVVVVCVWKVETESLRIERERLDGEVCLGF